MIKDEIRVLREQGYSQRQIVSMLGTSMATISAAKSNPVPSPLGLEVIRLRKEGKSYEEIQKLTKASKSTISKWCGTLPGESEVIKRNTKKVLDSRINAASEAKKREKVKNCPSDDVYRNWKRQIRKKRLDYLRGIFGDRCQVCGYDRSQRALNFHHVDEGAKQFNISGVKAESRMERLLTEVSKCVLVCTNCHAEIHDGITRPPALIQLPKLDEVPRDLVVFTETGLDESTCEREREWIKKKLEDLSHPRVVESAEQGIDLSRVTIKQVSRKAADEMCSTHHYLGASHKGGFRAFGCIYDGTLIGVAVITNPVNTPNSKCCEISRFVLRFNYKNLASKFLSLVLKELKLDGNYEFVQAFSDNKNHLGTIYKASNFREVGGKYETYNYSGIHKKTIYMRARSMGMSEHRYAEEFGLVRIKESSKTKFVYSLV
jgi:transposase